MKHSLIKRLSALLLVSALLLSLVPAQPVNTVSDDSFTAYAAEAPSAFSQEELFLCEGKSLTPQLKTTATPNGAYFVSDNPDVVSVDPETGKLTGKCYGTAVISLCVPAPDPVEPDPEDPENPDTPENPDPENPDTPENPDPENPENPEEEPQNPSQPIRSEMYDDTAFPTPFPEEEGNPSETEPPLELSNVPQPASAMEGEEEPETEPVLETQDVEAEEETETEPAEILDTLNVYCYRPSTYTVKKSGTSKTKPDPYRLLTVKNPTEDFPKSRTYGLFRQHFDKEHYEWLTAHGCSSVALADICQGYGVKKMTQLWLYEKGIAAIAKKNGVSSSTLSSKLPSSGTGGAPLGWFGMQSVLAYAGIPSAIKTWDKKDNSDGVAGITEALSQGHPVILMIHKQQWKNPRTGDTVRLSTVGNHFILLTGIDEDGYVMNTCGTSANCQTINSISDKATKVKITVKELLDHFIRLDKKPVRTANNDFFFSYGGGSGSCVWLEVTENSAHSEPLIGSIADYKVKLSESEYVYNGKAHKPTVTIDGLVENADFEVVEYRNNINAGTATVVIRGIHSYYGETQKTFTIKKATKVLSVSDLTVTTSSKKKSFSLGAKRLLGDGRLTYKSSKPSKVTVGSSGTFSVAKNFVGSVTVTVAIPTTSNTESQTEKVTVTVLPKTPSFSYARSPKKKVLQLKWKTASVSGYQVQYAYNSQFEGARTYTTSKKSAKSKKFTGLDSKKTVYVRMRTYKKVGGVKYQSGWSKVKKVTVK